MNQRAKKLIAGVSLAMTLLVTPSIANAADNHVYSQTVTRGTNNGQNGYWVNIVDRTYTWVSNIDPVFRSTYIANNAYDVINDWQWDWSTGPGKYHGLRDWNMSELTGAFGGFGWKSGNPQYGAAGVNQTIAPQTSRSLGEAYRFLKLAEMMEQNGVASLPDTVSFSIQADDGVEWDYSSQNYVNVDPHTHQSVLPNITSSFVQGNTAYNYWTSVRTYNISNLTPQLARQIASDLYSVAARCGSPIALDLNHDGKISVTGNSSAKIRAMRNVFVPEGAVYFDLEVKGHKSHYEWLKGTDDAFLVNDRGGMVSKAIAKDGEVDGRVLFGNAGGYENGFYKLAKLFDRGVALASTTGAGRPDGFVKGDDLQDLKVWIDTNHDAKVQANELRTLSSLGISEIGSKFRYKRNKDGEMLMQSYYVQNGKKYLTEDVWFAQDPAEYAGKGK